MSLDIHLRADKTFRGETAQVWQERLVALGWPDLAAEDMAHFLVDDETQKEAPRWSNLLMTEDALQVLAFAYPRVMAMFVAAMKRERGLG